MSTGLKEELGLGEPRAPGSTEQADKFKAEFQAELAKINERLRYTAAHAEQAKHDPLAGKRDKTCSAYQVALGRIDPTHPATAQGVIDQVLAAVKALVSAVDTLKQAAQKAFDAWTAREGDLDAVADKVREMAEWGHEKAAALQKVVDAIAEKVNLRKYEEALKALQQLADKLEALYEEFLRQKVAQKDYEASLPDLEQRLQAASTCELSSTSDLQEQISTTQTEMQSAAEAKDYENAVRMAGDLDAKLTEYETLLKHRDDYQAGLAALEPRLAEASVSQEKFAYAAPIQAEMATIQTEMETAAEAEDFENALRLLGDLEGKVDEFDAAIEAKKKEYEAARGALDTRLSDVLEFSYEALAAQEKDLQAGVEAIDAAAADEDYEKALTLVKEADGKVDAYAKALAAHEEKLKAEINKKLPDVKKTLGEMKDAKSPIKGNVEKLVAGIDKALGGAGNLEQAAKDVEEAAKQLGELKQVYDIRKRLEDKWDINKDDEARKIVDELQKSGKLNGLPMEARNLLVDQMMSGYLSDDDDKAIQQIFSIPAIDRRFNEMDKKTRDSIVKAYADSEEVKKIRDKWGSMSEEEKKKAVLKLTEIPVGKDGWDVGMPKNYKFTDKPKEDGRTSYGAYNYGSDTMTINLHDDAHADFTELLDTIAHEMGHKYQRKLIDDMECGRIKPGDPEYEQARAFLLHEKYKGESPGGFKKIYSTSPKEAHSREMGSDIKKGLRTSMGGGDGGSAEHSHTH